MRPAYEVTRDLKRALLRQMHAAGYPGVTMQDVELDHLVPLSLGGALETPGNL